MSRYIVFYVYKKVKTSNLEQREYFGFSAIHS